MGLQYTSGAGIQGGSAGADRYVVVRICGQTAANPQLIDTQKKRLADICTPRKQGASEMMDSYWSLLLTTVLSSSDTSPLLFTSAVY